MQPINSFTSSMRHPSFLSENTRKDSFRSSSFSSFPPVSEDESMSSSSSTSSSSPCSPPAKRESSKPTAATSNGRKSNLKRPNSAGPQRSISTPSTTTKAHKQRPSSAKTVSKSKAREFYSTYYSDKSQDQNSDQSNDPRRKRPQSAKSFRTASTSFGKTWDTQSIKRSNMYGEFNPLNLRGERRGGRKSDREYEKMRKREQGWDSTFILSHALEGEEKQGMKNSRNNLETIDHAVGSGLRAVRRRGGKNGVKKSKDNKKKETPERLRYNGLCAEITHLWQELHIPKRDCDFFREAYFVSKRKKSIPTELMHKVEEQRGLLLQHRSSTLHVLQCIQSREHALAGLRRIAAARYKPSSRMSSTPSSLQVAQPKLSLAKFGTESAPILPLTSHQNSQNRRERYHVVEFEPLKELDQEELEDTVADFQDATLQVTKAIHEWRTLLWRPQPFMWQGVNYLIKMQSDTRFFRKHLDTSAHDGVLLSDSKFSQKTVEKDSQCYQLVSQEAKIQCELVAEQERLLEAGFYIPMLRWSPGQEPVDASPSTEHQNNQINTGPTERDNKASEEEQEKEEEEYVYDDDEEEGEGETDVLEYSQSESEDDRPDCLRASEQHMSMLKRIRQQIRDEN